jgi:hypothetical protein
LLRPSLKRKKKKSRQEEVDPLDNKVVVNASVFLDSSPETQSVTVRPTLQKQLSNIIQQRNNNLGISRLWVEGSTNPVPPILGNLKLERF